MSEKVKNVEQHMSNVDAKEATSNKVQKKLFLLLFYIYLIFFTFADPD